MCLTTVIQNFRRWTLYLFAFSTSGDPSNNTTDDFVHTVAGHLPTCELVHAEHPPFGCGPPLRWGFMRGSRCDRETSWIFSNITGVDGNLGRFAEEPEYFLMF